MAIETICQGCSKKLRVAEEHAGKQARCPDCGTIYVVPAATGSISSYPSSPTTESRPLTSFNPPAKQIPERWLMKIDDGREFGPVDKATLDQWYSERRISATTQLKREHDSLWQSATAVYPALAAAAQSANPFADASRPAYGGGYGQQNNPYQASGPAYGRGSYAEPHRGALILVLGLVGFLITCFPLCIAAWVMGSSDLAKIKTGRMDPSGDGITRAGMIIGIIGTILQVGVLVLMCGGFGLAILAH